tara:strand:+ start:144 stop:1085 length:942 start_codon:yes stop_codon:yes gene_type:complete
MEYFKPDETWKVFGIKSREDYVGKNVIPGNFHSNVPEDIIKSFKTVTQLTAQAYYYYPLYDEALNKALRVFELAVKLKAKQLDLKKDSLNNLINKLCKIQNLEHLKESLHRARGIRNIHMHPENHSFGWFMAKGKGNIKMFSNLINEMFLDDVELKLIKEERQKFKNFMKLLVNSILCFQISDLEYFAQEINGFRIFPRSNSIKAAISVIPFYPNITEVMDKRYTEPFIIYLDEYCFKEESIIGKTLEGEDIIFRASKSELALAEQKKWKEGIAHSKNNEVKKYHFATTKDKFIWKCEEMIYNSYCKTDECIS